MVCKALKEQEHTRYCLVRRYGLWDLYYVLVRRHDRLVASDFPARRQRPVAAGPW